ncbi:hypothetical protein P9112_010109 [Eukaryota sp. TZLM1-RC]
MSLDFSNAFNSLSRRSIHGALLQYMPELIPYFQSTYCTYSNLHFGNNILISSSGVKQGDPLGPLLFCLAIHPILLQIQEMFPSLKMIAYMDDVVLIGELNIVKQATVCFKELFTKIGLQLNLRECVLLSNSPVFSINDRIEIQVKLYSIDAIRHLGSFLGNNDEITKKLFEKLNSISTKIDRMMNLDIQTHTKFTIITLCFSSNLNHIFRSTNTLVTRPLSQKLDELRAKVLSQLLGCKLFQIPDHAYLSPHYSGLGWTKASILTSGAFVDGCKNAIFEFSKIFADWEDLLMTTQSSTVFALNDEISRIDVEKWGRRFPQSFNGNIPEKNVLNLKYTLRTLQKRFTEILRLNLLKCVLLSNSPVSTIINDIEIQAKLYSIDAIRHLGSFLGNNDEITKKLFEKLNSISDKIDRIMNLDIKKHIKFTIIRLCFSSNFNHIFRSTNPLVTRPLAQKFNELRAKVLSQLLGCKMFQIPDHAYLSPQYGGLGWTKASILTSCAFVGGCRNAIFEFSERFADWEDLLMTTQSSTVFALNEEISRIDVEKWGRCFPQSFNGNIPEKNVLNLKYTLRTLQKRLTGMYENDLYNNICSSAVLNQDLHSLLLEKGVCENKVSDSSLFVNIVPRRFGLCATNEAFVTKMRLYLNIPINQLLSKEKCICSNSPQLTLRHALNCSKLITYRSSLHDAVRDTVFNMAQTARISCIKEPLLKETLSLNNFGSDDRGDVYCDWIDNSEAIVDFVSCNVANDTLVHRRKLNPVAALDF